MQIQGLTTVLPVDDVQAAAKTWAALLGAEPTFVDGDRWAQFDVAGRRLALAGTDRMSDAAGVMIKVDDLEAARTAVVGLGLTAGEIRTGPHERRFQVLTPGGWPAVYYAPHPPS
ncbi:MAG TPA: hypothetical protein VG939_13815 [Caulobacteraceae bacterium]|nr:hypothetical protein [Caulobacteraceae bacterium]